MRVVVIALASWVSACTVSGEYPLDWLPFEPGNACAIERDVFGPYCVTCHDGTVEPLDLRGAALATLPGKVGEYGEVIVVPNDPDASFIVEKVLGPSPDHGDKMPLVGDLPQAAKDALIAWIEGGAPACATIGDDIIVGGTVDFGGPPSDFTARQPGWVADGECAAGQWWAHEGDDESEAMHPGNDCIDCHAREGGPGFSYAGTVYPMLREVDDCRGVPGVKVEILDADGNVLRSTKSNEGGNFYFEGGYVDGYRARLTYDGRTREMTTPVFGNHSCNDCHSPSGSEDAPGRVVAP